MKNCVIRVEYDAYNGTAYRDGEVDTLIEDIKSAKTDQHIIVASEIVITGIRAAIAKKVLESSSIIFVYKGQEIIPNDDGRLPVWPYGFCNRFGDYLAEIIG